MAYPTLEQYNTALQSPQFVLLDPELKRGTVKASGLGLPLALCGGFALTYEVTVGVRKFALRCFHKESQELEYRYRAISAQLKQLNSSYFLPFEFNPAGIRIDRKDYPTVKMAWASGRTLAEFLEAHHRDASALQRVRAALASLADFLERSGLSHGDIQPENVMVSADGASVQLIDYDGLYVDALKGRKATELGQLNFQHPSRSADHFGPSLDRFSFLTLDVALQALIASPRIWSSSRSEPSAVVFRRNDFLDPTSSLVFQDVVAIAGLKAQVENLAKVAAGAFPAIPSLMDFRLGKGVPAGAISIRQSPVTVAYQGPYVVCDASDYAQALRLVGSRVELVGQVHSVRKGWSKKTRKPHIFVNFSDWRGRAVKLSIWSDCMDLIKTNLPDETWKGRWLSVVGLMDPPYSNTVGNVSYTHLSITITGPGQIQQLPEVDAKFRLAGPGKPAGSAVTTPPSRNAGILVGMGGKAPAATTSAPPARPSPAPVKTANQQLLSSMQSTAPPVKPVQTPSSPSKPTTHAKPSASNAGCVPLVICAVVFLLLLRACAG